MYVKCRVAEEECDMIPLMMQANFKAKGWLGLILGTRLWCPCMNNPRHNVIRRGRL